MVELKQADGVILKVDNPVKNKGMIHLLGAGRNQERIIKKKKKKKRR